MKVSVIIPSYNASKHLVKTLKSVLKQTLFDLEVIVIDDGSTDNTKELINQISDTRVKYYFKENGGVSVARNYGMVKAEGLAVLFLDADDILSETFLEDRFNTLYQSKYIGCASNVKFIDERDEFIEKGTYSSANESNHILKFSKDKITCPSAYLFDLSFLKKNKILFNPILKSSADKFFLLEVLSKGEITLVDNAPLFYRIITNSMSHKISKELVKDQILFKKEFRQKLCHIYPMDRSFYSRLNYTIGSYYFFLKNYFSSIKYILKSLFQSPKTFFYLKFRNKN